MIKFGLLKIINIVFQHNLILVNNQIKIGRQRLLKFSVNLIIYAIFTILLKKLQIVFKICLIKSHRNKKTIYLNQIDKNFNKNAIRICEIFLLDAWSFVLYVENNVMQITKDIKEMMLFMNAVLVINCWDLVDPSKMIMIKLC